jgi:DNA adenine methylase
MDAISHLAEPVETYAVQTPFLSPFRWAGSKKKSIKKLEIFWRPSYRRYVEPFCGSACLFFRLTPASALLSDTNAELIRALQVIRTTPEHVYDLVTSYSNNAETYYALRKLDPISLENEQRCARFIYLNRFCFNGLYRTNTAGNFNVPYGGRRNALPSKHDFLRYSRLLSTATLKCCDFEETLAQTKRGDFIYLDPPYHLQSVRTFRQYDSNAFDFSALWRLRACLDELQDRGIAFLLSYADSDEGRFLARGLRHSKIVIGRNIAGFASNRRRYSELLIYPDYVRPREAA